MRRDCRVFPLCFFLNEWKSLTKNNSFSEESDIQLNEVIILEFILIVNSCFSYFIGFLLLLTWVVPVLGVVPVAINFGKWTTKNNEKL